MLCWYHCHPQWYCVLHNTAYKSCFQARVWPCNSKWYEKSIVNKSTINVSFKEIILLRKEPKESLTKLATTYNLCSWFYWNWFMNMRMQISQQNNSVIITNDESNLHIESQNPNLRKRPFSMMHTPTYFLAFKHMPFMSANQNPLFLLLSFCN